MEDVTSITIVMASLGFDRVASVSDDRYWGEEPHVVLYLWQNISECSSNSLSVTGFGQYWCQTG